MTFETENSTKSDSQLLRLYAMERSEAAFSELADRYSRMVFQVCLRELRDRSLAEDASQAVFILLSRKAKSLTNRDSIAGWLFTASRLVSRNLMKTEMRRQSLEANIMPPSVTYQQENALWMEIEPHFNDALFRLKASDREAILLRYVQDMSLVEVGTKLGINENTARMRVNRAIEKVRSHLQKAGIIVAAGTLALLITQESSKAVPTFNLASIFGGSGAPTSTALADSIMRSSAKTVSFRAGALLGIGLVLIFGGSKIQRSYQASKAAEARGQFFTQIDGVWKGTLEFADDRSKVHQRYPTSVSISARSDGSMLVLKASYTGSASEDITTFQYISNAENFGVKNDGPMSSHRLAAQGDLKQTSEGFVFEGRNNSADRDIRLTMIASQTKMTLLEEYKQTDGKDFEFRNQFSLSR